MTLHMLRRAFALIMASFVLVGCATTISIQEQELREPAPNEGVVLGSVSIRGGKDLLGRTKWEFLVSPLGTDTGYSIGAHRDGDEEVFAIALPAGAYRMHALSLPFSNFRYNMDVRFEVRPGTPTYIGRLLVEFPEGLITTFTAIRVSVQNARDANIAAVQTKYRKQFQDVSTRLAVSGSSSTLPGKSTADARLEKDTVIMVMALDGAESKDCKQRQIVNREIVSADTSGANENWIVDRCGLLVRYRVSYRPKPTGGTYISVVPGEVVK